MSCNKNYLDSIHNCVKVSLENDYFKEKLTEFYKENKKLKQDVLELKNENKNLKEKIELENKFKMNKKEISCQTSEDITIKDKLDNKPKENQGSSKCSLCQSVNKINQSKLNITNKKSNFDPDIYNKLNKKHYIKLCEMQHNLLKKYEDEVNLNTVKQDLINRMKIELDQYELKCKQLESELDENRTKLANFSDLESKQKVLLIDLETYKLKCEKYKQSLNLFDDKFFNEIEQLKVKYDESVKMNKYYEKYLKDKQDFSKLISIETKNKKSKKNRVKFNLENEIDIGHYNEYDEDDDNKMKMFSNSIIKELDDFNLNNEEDYYKFDDFKSSFMASLEI